jgi:hypothetical protein
MRQTAIQCIDKATNRKGTFFFDDSEPFVATSPVFNSLVELYNWERLSC